MTLVLSLDLVWRRFDGYVLVLFYWLFYSSVTFCVLLLSYLFSLLLWTVRMDVLGHWVCLDFDEYLGYGIGGGLMVVVWESLGMVTICLVDVSLITIDRRISVITEITLCLSEVCIFYYLRPIDCIMYMIMFSFIMYFAYLLFHVGF